MKDHSKGFWKGVVIAVLVFSLGVNVLSVLAIKDMIKQHKQEVEALKSDMSRPATLDTIQSCLEKMGFKFDQFKDGSKYVTFDGQITAKGLDIIGKDTDEPRISLAVQTDDKTKKETAYIFFRDSSLDNPLNMTNLDGESIDKLLGLKDKLDNFPFTWSDDKSDPNVYLRNKRLVIDDDKSNFVQFSIDDGKPTIECSLDTDRNYLIQK